jgi:hypothetical protein
VGNYQNPYAAPTAEAPSAGAPVVGEPQPWSVGEAIRSAWEVYKANWAPLTLGYGLTTLLGAIPGQIAPSLAFAGVVQEDTPKYWALHVPLTIVGWLLAEFFGAGFTLAALRATRSGRASFGDFFAAGGKFLVFVLSTMLRTAATVLGLLLFIVPGVIVSLGFANAPFYVLDQNMGPIASLQASWRSTEGQKGQMFALALAEIGIVFAGLLAFCFGVLVAVPVMVVARAIVYTRMSGTAGPALGGPGGPTGPSVPSYGYGGYRPYGSYGGRP